MYVPDYSTFHFAASYAQGGSLVAVESADARLGGWAMEVQALNLLTGEVTRDTRSEEQRAQLNRLHFYGNNGWTTGFGKNQAGRILTALRRQGLLEEELVLGYMLGKGHHGKAIDGLAKLIQDLA